MIGTAQELLCGGLDKQADRRECGELSVSSMWDTHPVSFPLASHSIRRIWGGMGVCEGPHAPHLTLSLSPLTVSVRLALSV